jgi:sugar lactone lactonase YvrE
VAGSGTAGFANGAGAVAQFSAPTALALDAAGGVLFCADSRNHRLRRIAFPGGGGAAVVSTLAGSGTAGGADGAALSATLSTPWGLALEPATGALLVSEAGGLRLRRLSPNGTHLTTLAGNGSAGLGDGLGAGATFAAPRRLVFSATGLLLCADAGGAIRAVSTAVGGVSTLGLGALAGPHGLAAPPSGGLLLVADTAARVLRALVWTLASASPSGTVSPSATPSFTATPSGTPSGTGTPSPTQSLGASPTATPSGTPTGTGTGSCTGSGTPSPTPSLSRGASASPSPAPPPPPSSSSPAGSGSGSGSGGSASTAPGATPLPPPPSFTAQGGAAATSPTATPTPTLSLGASPSASSTRSGSPAPPLGAPLAPSPPTSPTVSVSGGPLLGLAIALGLLAALCCCAAAYCWHRGRRAGGSPLAATVQQQQQQQQGKTLVVIQQGQHQHQHHQQQGQQRQLGQQVLGALPLVVANPLAAAPALAHAHAPGSAAPSAHRAEGAPPGSAWERHSDEGGDVWFVNGKGEAVWELPPGGYLVGTKV